MKLAKAALAAVSLFPTFFSAPRGAQAQSKPEHRAFEFSVFGGGSFIGDGQYATSVLGTTPAASRVVGLRYGGGYLFGASLTENRYRHVGATLEYTFSNQPVRFTNLVNQPSSVGLSHSVHRFAYELLYYPLDRSARLRPYVFAGPGITLFRVAQDSILAGTAASRRLSDPWKFSMSWGGGAKYLIQDRWAVSVQFTDSVSGVPRYGLPGAAYYSGATLVPGFRPKGYLHQKLISIGVIYQWDR